MIINATNAVFPCQEVVGGYVYVENDSGKRIVCPHLAEMSTVAEVLGENANTRKHCNKGFNGKKHYPIL